MKHFDTRIGYAMMRLAAAFPHAMPAERAEETRKTRFLSGLCPNLKSALAWEMCLDGGGRQMTYEEIKDVTAHTVAHVLYHHYFYIFGTPLRLMMDNDLAFTSEVVQELCNLFGVKRVCTSTYHPQSNGAIERQHQTVIKMIGRLSQDEKANWPKHLPELIQAYNGMRSAITGYSPHYVLFGY